MLLTGPAAAYLGESRERGIRPGCSSKVRPGGRGFKRGNDGVEFGPIPRRGENATVSSHRNSHYRSEAWRDSLETPESLCRQPREERIRRGVDAFRSGRGGP